MQVIDPAGVVRGTVADGAGLEDALAVAWSLRPCDRFLVTAVDTNHWGLTIYRPDRVPVTQPLDVRSVYVATEDDGEKRQAAMIEAAWLDLVDEGWTLRQAVG